MLGVVPIPIAPVLVRGPGAKAEALRLALATGEDEQLLAGALAQPETEAVQRVQEELGAL